MRHPFSVALGLVGIMACTDSRDEIALRVAPVSLVVPNELQQPGTQPGEVNGLESPDKCDNCHGGYAASVEPAHNWRGGMMSQATRDPLFWATLSVAEQDFAGVGDLCLRCHSPDGWISGRSTPTNGAGLIASDTAGVSCDLCHKLTNPDGSEWAGVQTSPFLANDEATVATGYYGSGQYVLWGGSAKLGPYGDASARHQFGASSFHRESALCGTCHDVSNPVTGDLAPSHGALLPLAAGTFGGTLGGPIANKAAFNNFPYEYGIVERTFSEHMASALPSTRVASYPSLPPELRGGALKAAYEAAAAVPGCDYEDGTPRFYTCQTCHMRAITGQGCNKNPPVRKDLPLHDLTGGNFWAPEAIAWLDQRGLLRAGGGLTSAELTALADGITRAKKQLSSAASLVVAGDSVRVVNQTGHKLISGYPEGRRMWLNVTWYGSAGIVLREDGAYGPLAVTLGGQALTVETLLDPHARVWGVHMALSQPWANALLALGLSPDLPVAFDRVTSQVTMTLGDVAALEPDDAVDSFHFALNDTVALDNRIPPYGMRYDDAVARNITPVPPTQYGGPGPGQTYLHYDDVPLNPPSGALWAKLRLMYQPTSWEYVQFLVASERREDPFLADEADNLLAAWLATGMAAPYVMTEATWGEPPAPPTPTSTVDALMTWALTRGGAADALATSFASGASVGIGAHVSADGADLEGAQLFISITGPDGSVLANLSGFTDATGEVLIVWKTSRKQAPGTHVASVRDVLKNGTVYQAGAITAVSFEIVR